MINPYVLPFDQSGVLLSNRIEKEKHALAEGDIRLVVLEFCAYYKKSVVVTHTRTDGSTATLSDSQYQCAELLPTVTQLSNEEAYGVLLITDKTLKGFIEVTYQAVGGEAFVKTKEIKTFLEEVGALNPIDWKTIDKPKTFQPTEHHPHRLTDIYGFKNIKTALERIASAVQIGDIAIEKQVLKKSLGGQIEELFSASADQASVNHDTVALALNSVKQTCVDTNIIHLENKSDFAVLEELSKTMNDLIHLQTKRYAWRQYAMSLKELCDQQFAMLSTVMDVPKYIQRVDLWLDFTDTEKASVVGGKTIVKDDASGRHYSANVASLVTNPAFEKQALNMGYGLELKQTQGAPVRIGKGSSVLAVYAGVNVSSKPKGCLLSGNGKLLVDTTKSNGLSLWSTNSEFEVVVENWPTYAKFCVGVSLSENPSLSYAEHNCLETNYNGQMGLKEKPVVGEHSFTSIGHPTQAQQLDLLELIVIQSGISEYEMDALMHYFKIKYGVRSNLLSNVRFNMGLCDFESDYAVEPLARTKQTIDCVQKVSLNSFVFGSYDMSPYISALKADHLYGKVFAVNASVDSNKAFWRKKITLSPGKVYRLFFNLFYETTKPTICLKINGIKTQLDKTPVGQNAELPMEFVFRTDTEVSVLELFETTQSPAILQFALDEMVLIRDYSARV